MDDTTFEQWSATLLELRQARYDSIKLQIDERGKEYRAKDLFDHLMVSLDQIMTQWWEYERRSWDNNPPADLNLAVDTLREELDSVADFEIEASQKDIESAREMTVFIDEELEKGREDLQTFVADLKKNYMMKIETMANNLKKPATPAPAPVYSSAPRGSHGRSGGNGIGLLLMFLVGLGLGTGVAVFFRESGRQMVDRLKEEKEKLTNEKREIISEFTELQETYFQLASGKLLTLPALERAMKPLREESAAKKRAAEAEFSRSRETLFKKIPAGDRLDRALVKLDDDKQNRFREIENQMNVRLEPYIKQQQIHEELMKKQ